MENQSVWKVQQFERRQTAECAWIWQQNADYSYPCAGQSTDKTTESDAFNI